MLFFFDANHGVAREATPYNCLENLLTWPKTLLPNRQIKFVAIASGK
jgi:hypothetical protein